MVDPQMSERLKHIREVTSRAMLHLTITSHAGDTKGLMDKLAQPLNQSDRVLLASFTNLLSINLNNQALDQFPSIDAVLGDGFGNEILWTACCVNTGSDARGPYRLKGGLMVLKLELEGQDLLGIEFKKD